MNSKEVAKRLRGLKVQAENRLGESITILGMILFLVMLPFSPILAIMVLPASCYGVMSYYKWKSLEATSMDKE